MLMLPLLNSIFIYQALIPQFICGIYRFLRKITAIFPHFKYLHMLLMSNQRFHIFDKILYFLKIRQDLFFCSIKGIIIITRLPKFI